MQQFSFREELFLAYFRQSNLNFQNLHVMFEDFFWKCNVLHSTAKARGRVFFFEIFAVFGGYHHQWQQICNFLNIWARKILKTLFEILHQTYLGNSILRILVYLCKIQFLQIILILLRFIWTFWFLFLTYLDSRL